MPGWTRGREGDLADRLARLVPAPGAISVACGWPGGEPVTISVRARPDTRFLSCSSCKPVTAAAVLAATEQGLLDLDDEPAAGLAVRQLLSHTAGLAGDLYDWPPDPASPDPVRAAVERDVPTLPRVPSGQYWYSNVGYQLLGVALADACGCGFEEAVQRLVLRPLGMVDAAYGDPLAGPGVAGPGVARPDVAGPVQLGAEPFAFNPAQIPAGGLLATPADLVRFASALVTGGLLGATSLRLMTEPATTLAGPEHPAAGWSVRHDRGPRLLTTAGGYGPYGASGVVDLDTGQAAWALFNHPAGYALDVAGLLDEVGPPGTDPFARTAGPAPGSYLNPWGGLVEVGANAQVAVNGRDLAPGARIRAGADGAVLLNETAIVIGSTPFLPIEVPRERRVGTWPAGRYTAPFDRLELEEGPPRLRSRERGETTAVPLDTTRWATDLGVLDLDDDVVRISRAYAFRRV